MLKESDFVKIQVSVPVADADKIRKALKNSGAGEQGEYSGCSSSWRSVGRFTPGDSANPTTGERGVSEEVEEEIIQTICHKENLEYVIKAIKAMHPYEEPAIDIFPRYEI